MSRNNAALSSSLLQLHLVGGKYIDSSELPQPYISKEPKSNIIEHSLMGTESSTSQSMTTWRAPYRDLTSPSKFYMQPVPLSVQANSSASLNGTHYENGLISTSLTDAFGKKLKLSFNDVLFGQPVDTAESNNGDDEPFESLEQIEAQTIGNLLPDDDDLLAGAIHDFACVTRPIRDDAEDDLFYSGGGMELEANGTFSSKVTSDFMNEGLDNQVNVIFPSGVHPTRTLLVRNINSNVEDVDLRVLFEKFGDIQALYTAGKNRGFVMISYYDLRAAQNAVRALQNKPFRCHKLDIHFLGLKDCPSERDINKGMLVVFNLDSSITTDNIHQLFGVYGEIKEIRETSNKHHQKIIEFYDVRDAEAALFALDRGDFAGKRINTERFQSSGASSGQQFPPELNEKESRGYRQDGRYYKSPSECFGLMTLGANTSNGLNNGAIQGIHSAVQMPTRSFMETNLLGVSHNLSSVASAGNHHKPSGQCELNHLVNQVGLHRMPTFQPHSLPEFHDRTMSAMAMSISSAGADGINFRSTHGAASGSVSRHSLEHSEDAFGSSGNGSCPLHGHQYVWNNSNTYHHPPSSMWQNLPPFMNTQPPQQMHGLPRGLPHMSNPVVPLHHHHVGSAPAVNPSIWDKRHTYAGNCMEVASHQPGSLGSVGFSGCSPSHSLEFGSRNIFPHATGNGVDPSYHVGIPSPQLRGQVFCGRGTVTSPAIYDGPSDRIRSRKGDASSNQGDNKKQFELDIDRIRLGEDSRTTLMIKNIPNKYTSKMLLATIDEHHKGIYDFIYLPIDFKNKCNVGYAFINMIEPQHIIPFYQAFNGKKWEKFNSEKVASIAYARIQGKSALITHFQNSSLMNEDKRCRPILFHSDGPNVGDQEPFPVGVNIRSRRSRTAVENHRGSPSDSSNGEESSSSGSIKDE